MRGTSIFSLPGQLIGAALGTTKEVEGRQNKSFIWRMRYQFFIWRTDYWADQALKNYKAGKCKVLRDEHFESVENFINLP